MPPAERNLSYSDAQKARIETFSRLARQSVAHRGEKGRILEGIVTTALREVLPLRFSLGTGFAVNSDGLQSKQLDIVIYDHQQNAPIMFDGNVGLFPIEALYAAIEVKTTLSRDEITRSVDSFALLRRLAASKHYVRFSAKAHPERPDELIVDPQRVKVDLAPRTFIFALESTFSGPDKLLAAFEEAVKGTEAHVHGACILNADCVFSQIAYGGGAFKAHQGDAFRIFCRTVLLAVSSVQMMPAWMEDYTLF